MSRRRRSLPVAPRSAPLCHICEQNSPMGGWRCCESCWRALMAGERTRADPRASEDQQGEQLQLGGETA